MGGKKQCTKCKKILPATSQYYWKHPRHKDGFYTICKECANTRLRYRYKTDPEFRQRHLDGHKKYLRNNPDAKKRIREQTRLYHRDPKNRKRINAQQRDRYHNDPEVREKILSRTKKYHNTPEYKNKRRIINSKRRTKVAGSNGYHNELDVRNIFDEQFGYCAYCGVVLNKFHEDHIVPLTKNGSNDSINIVLSCPSCNLRKNNRTPTEWAFADDTCPLWVL